MDQELPKFSERQIAGLLKQIDDDLSARDLASDLTSIAQEVRLPVDGLRGMFQISIRRACHELRFRKFSDFYRSPIIAGCIDQTHLRDRRDFPLYSDCIPVAVGRRSPANRNCVEWPHFKEGMQVRPCRGSAAGTAAIGDSEYEIYFKEMSGAQGRNCTFLIKE